MMDLINLLRNTGLSGWIAFAVIYHFGTGGAWRRSRVGPWIMGLCLVPLLTLLVGVITAWLGNAHPVALTARLFLMCIINVMPLWLAVLFVRRQREIGGIQNEDQPKQVHEGDSGGGERRVRPVPAGNHGEQRGG
jgi:hypothetical protein